VVLFFTIDNFSIDIYVMIYDYIASKFTE